MALIRAFSKTLLSRLVVSLAAARSVLTIRPIRPFSSAVIYRNETIPAAANVLANAKDVNGLAEGKDEASEEESAVSDILPSTFLEVAEHPEINKHVVTPLTHVGIGYKDLTPVQQRSILPMLREEKGIVCRAKTGTGKTLAFIIPTLHTCLTSENAAQIRDNKVQAIVVAPTRDLALQIESEFHKLISKLRGNQRKNISYQTLIGGRKTVISPRDIPAIVIATPGRLLDCLENTRGFAKACSDIKYRIYDEADRLLDQGFEEHLNSIDSILRGVRKDALVPDTPLKSVLFSATVDKNVDKFARNTISNNYRFIDCVDKDEPEAHKNIHQTLVKTDNIYQSQIGAMSFILKNLNKNKNFKAIFFIPTIAGVEWCTSTINRAIKNKLFDFQKRRSFVTPLHGKMTQSRRDRAVKSFRQLESGVLVCTDVAARGLDFKDVSHVVQFAPSIDLADYVHKVGRTARAGAKGKAIIFSSPCESNYIRMLEDQTGITFNQVEKYEDFETDDQEFKEKINMFEDEFEEYGTSLISFYRSQAASYKFNLRAVFDDIVSLMREFLKDPEYKFPAGRRLISGLGLSYNDISSIMALPPNMSPNDPAFKPRGSSKNRSGSGFGRSGYRSNNRDFNDRRGGSRFNDRGFNSRGSDRGLNDRGFNDRGFDRGYKDRGFNNRSFNDRGFDRGFDRDSSRYNQRDGSSKSRFGSFSESKRYKN
ncbi:DEAD-domain-containing protein [Hyphopichia burtonii NRRL Y-1933]|uniref:ATP-dependent RNA helicase n=1 Tax=Hyphopichia burtonii NRRL Y-1933 TaxID=984485 RepID=A0A1E4RR46_9ASCO|nr:DEAD-domain-containing protein [Hyphopichia burtonii NRRL Y-1933]ODV69764.1 DEAD-domain-containing protein [Hyphopichia burtonii NRRL Y-1933]